MNYKKYTTNAYNLHIINTDKFKSIMIKINFKKKIEKKDITYRNLLTKILLESNKTYSNKRDLEIACEELYNLSLSTTNSISGNYIVTSFNGMFLNEKYTEKEMNNKSLQFILDLIFKPNTSNKEFAYFDLAKRLVKDEIIKIKDNPRIYSQVKLLEELGKDTPIAYNSIGYLDDLETISNKDLYKYYEGMLKSDLIDIFIIGDFDTDKIKNIIHENFKINTVKKKGIEHFIVHNKIIKKPKTITDIMPLEQAKLNIGFKLKDLTDFEKKYVLNVYTFILGGGPDSKLFKDVREKHSLCYYIGCTHKPVANIMTISAGINKEDFKKCLTLIKKDLNKMTKGDFERKDIEAAKMTYINSLKEIEDYQPNTLKIFESHEYLGFDLLDERSLNIKNVTKDDIINLSKKIHLDTIHLLEGDENEKD